MSQDLTVIAPESAAPALAPGTMLMAPVPAHSDAQLIGLWLHGCSVGTRRAYVTDIRHALGVIGHPLREITLGDLQSYQGTLHELAASTQCRRLCALKSLLSFGQRTGYLVVNAGALLRLPKFKRTLAERILDEDCVIEMLTLERDPRNKAILRLLYLGGLRISELCALKLRDLQPRGEAGQITVFGKGGRTRVVLLKASIWTELARMRGQDPDDPVFRSRQGGGPLDPSQVHRIVKSAARRAGLSPAVSAHWLRHAHVSHALDHGAPPHLVQATVGHASLATTGAYAHARPNDSSSHYLRG